MEEQPNPPGMDAASLGDRAGEAAEPVGAARLRRPDRGQALMRALVLEELLPPDHQARVLWRLVEKMDLSRFEAVIRARGSGPGRASTDPRLLVALWLYAFTQGLGSARELQRLCLCHDAYRWICGGVAVNHHTLSDFQLAHREALAGLFEATVMRLVKDGLVRVERVSQDGVRVRASAGSASFRRGSTLQKLRQEAREHLEGLEAQARDGAWTARRATRRADRDTDPSNQARPAGFSGVKLEKFTGSQSRLSSIPTQRTV